MLSWTRNTTLEELEKRYIVVALSEDSLRSYSCNSFFSKIIADIVWFAPFTMNRAVKAYLSILMIPYMFTICTWSTWWRNSVSYVFIHFFLNSPCLLFSLLPLLLLMLEPVHSFFLFLYSFFWRFFSAEPIKDPSLAWLRIRLSRY